MPRPRKAKTPTRFTIPIPGTKKKRRVFVREGGQITTNTRGSQLGAKSGDLIALTHGELKNLKEPKPNHIVGFWSDGKFLVERRGKKKSKRK